MYFLCTLRLYGVEQNIMFLFYQAVVESVIRWPHGLGTFLFHQKVIAFGSAENPSWSIFCTLSCYRRAESNCISWNFKQEPETSWDYRDYIAASRCVFFNFLYFNVTFHVGRGCVYVVWNDLSLKISLIEKRAGFKPVHYLNPSVSWNVRENVEDGMRTKPDKLLEVCVVSHHKTFWWKMNMKKMAELKV